MTSEQVQVDGAQNPQQNADTPQQPAAENVKPWNGSAWQKIRRFAGRINWGVVNAILTLGATIAIAVFTGQQVKYGNLQWDATDKQWKSMIDQNKQTKSTVELDQRPWLNIEPPVLEAPTTGKNLSAIYQIKNTGKTPGKILNRRAEIFSKPVTKESFESLIPDALGRIVRYELLKDEMKGGYVIGPGATGTYDAWNPDEVIDDAWIDDFKQARKTLLILIYVKYEDVFGQEHRSRSLFYFDPTGKCQRGVGFDQMD